MEGLAGRNPWVSKVYDLCCAHIHLSDQHMHHFISRTSELEDRERELWIGAASEHIDPDHFMQLCQAFQTATQGVLTLVEKWAGARKRAASIVDLRARYCKAV